ncbi:efflux RND transporter permease subunit [Micromonospora craniellae]|uniref:Efflux RND transporter permease subunit n=1 Tax=Micromonospora craniellae TaxID=2294034 RepID=A0A372G4Z9_9ACTN|nr:efflux RND transporter permease subunit [Micromonospora craniellae]QOC90559.1 efflux RND transporter permease subunit [Micromonospora craniellae]RFS48058.1 efflux RND transporter permease subunit [Micromonospora craniellae]
MSLLARFSLANRGLVALIAVVTTAFGAYAVPSLKQQLLPSLEFPAAFIVASYPGAGPEVVESQVTVPIENSLRGIPALDSVTSTSSEGLSTIQVQYEFGTDLDDVVNKMQTALNRTRLPDEVEPQVIAGSTDDLPAVVLAASGGDERALAAKLRDTVVPELAAIEGVRGVELTGVRDDLVVISPDPAKLSRAKVQPTAIGTALQANGVTVPAGAVLDGNRALPVQVGSPLTTLDDLRAVIVAPPKGKTGPVRLGDVATVSEQLAPATAITRTNGRESLGIAVTADPDGNAVQISHAVADRLDGLRAATGAELTVVLDQAPFVEKSIKTLSTEGLLGLIMAVVVILVFLLSIRSTVVTAVSIPLSVVVALLALWIGDYSLNLLTLGALTVAVGRVVDDSIVVLENIKRHLTYGGPKREAILTAVREVAGAVTASTLTTVAVFAPIALVGGFVGQLFAPFAITTTVALLASLLVSLTVVPVLAYWFLKPVTGADGAAVRRAAEERELRSPLQRAYLPVIRFATGRRVFRLATLAAGLLVLLGTFGLSRQLETNFLDDSGQDTLNIRQELPVGTGLAGTDAAARRVEAVLAETPGVRSYQVTAGGGDSPWAGGAGNNVASYALLLGEETDAKEMRGILRDRIGALGAEAGEITFPAGQGGASANELAVVVRAADPEALTRAAEQAEAVLTRLGGVEDVSSTRTEQVPRVEVTVDRTAASRAGFTEAAVGQLVAQAFRGTPLGQVSLDEGARDVVLRLSAPPPTTVTELREMRLGAVKLDDIAEVTETTGPQQVRRIDGERSVSVTGTVTGSDLGAISAELQRELDAIDVPGATLTIGGVSAEQRDTFADLGLAVLAAIAIVFLIMMATFRSVVQALILLVSIPFAATGAVVLLLATGTALSVPALIGVLMLVGIVVTNAIVLLDLVNQYRAQGMDVREAVVEGGRHRLRPILMTAIATIFALTPMAFGLTGEGGFISRPLAIVVIGGLLSSTLLTLILVPTLYAMVEDTKASVRARRRGRSGPTPEDEPRDADPGDASGAEPAGREAAAAESPAEERKPESRPVPAAPSGALIESTDQFEVLRLPKSRNSPFPPTD